MCCRFRICDSMDTHGALQVCHDDRHTAVQSMRL